MNNQNGCFKHQLNCFKVYIQYLKKMSIYIHSTDIQSTFINNILDYINSLLAEMYNKGTQLQCALEVYDNTFKQGLT